MGHAFAQLPIITSHPKSANITYNNVGQTTTFSVSATNANTFQWQYSIGGVNFENLSDDPSYVGTQTERVDARSCWPKSRWSQRITATNR